MEIKGLDKIYLVHYAKLKDRGEYLRKRIKELGIEDIVEWDIAPADEVLSNKELSAYDSSESEWSDRIKVLGEHVKKSNRILTKSEIAVTLQHTRVISKIAKGKGAKISMVIEDDGVLDDHFLENLSKIIKKLEKKKWDICYTDKGGLFAEPQVKKDEDGVGFYKPENRGSNTSGSYLLTPGSAKKIARLMKKFTLAIDAELGYIQKKYKLDVYWSVPFITRQGSIEGIYSSNQRQGSLTEKVNKILRKVEKVSPGLSGHMGKAFKKAQELRKKLS